MTEIIQWGMGCTMCAYTGEEWLHGVQSGDGWTGKPCPHCVEGGEFYHEDDYQDYDEPPTTPIRWCECPDNVGVGTCPTCGGEMCPF